MATSMVGAIITIPYPCTVLSVTAPNPSSYTAVDASCVVRVVSRAYPSEWPARSFFTLGFFETLIWGSWVVAMESCASIVLRSSSLVR